MSPKVSVDREMCIGSGNCVHLAPGAIALDDEGVAIIEDPNAVGEQQLVQAERSCPTSAIIVENE